MSGDPKEIAGGGPILAVHLGDMYVRAAWKDSVNAPTRMEDADEFQRYCTPSLIAIDKGNPLLGYTAQMAASAGAAKPLLWRYSRGGLNESTFVVRDGAGRGLTASAFTALTVRRMVEESAAWLSAPPDVVLVVPDKLGALARLELSTMVADATQRSVSICGEDQALATGLNLPNSGNHLMVSVDDDALRLRIVDLSASDAQTVASKTATGLGMGALKEAWLGRWSQDVADLLPGAPLFENTESADFEKVWQDIWQCLDTDTRLHARMPTWTVVRGSAVLPLIFPIPVARAEVERFATEITRLVEQFLAGSKYQAQSLATVAVVAPLGLGRLVAAAMGKDMGFNKSKVWTTDPSVYATGGAKRRLATKAPGFDGLAAAPFKLGALGAAKDEGGLVLKPLIEAGVPMPANASFTIMANRDVQRRLTIKLALQKNDDKPVLCHMTEFGPLQGHGMLRVKVNVLWDSGGRLHATAVDAETEIALPVMDDYDVVAAGPVLGAAHIRLLD
jgi:hypothetical protein